MDEVVNVTGGFASNPPLFPTATAATPAGFYALPSNIARHTQTGFAVVPEVTANVGYNITYNIRAYLGYSFLYIDNVARPGTQIDHAISTAQSPVLGGNPNIPLTAQTVPAFSFTRTDFWAQGLNLGLQIAF
jgi:hypothetical protein